ncbi:MAG TPA: hypothetical protein VK453_06480 [Micromonosporaceae bacterium]|nr:hypothetical protein [Micromonosporaceae bacterium]
MIRIARILIAGVMLAGVLTVASASPALARCLPDPAPSPYAFTGTVVATRWDGRLARVRTDGGRVVIVRGGASRLSVTSVDRYYEVGQRYEFHPTNDRSPYLDNLCTATRPL